MEQKGQRNKKWSKLFCMLFMTTLMKQNYLFLYVHSHVCTYVQTQAHGFCLVRPDSMVASSITVRCKAWSSLA